MAKHEWYDPISGRILTKDLDIQYYYSTGTWPYGAEPLNSYSGTWFHRFMGCDVLIADTSTK